MGTKEIKQILTDIDEELTLTHYDTDWESMAVRLRQVCAELDSRTQAQYQDRFIPISDDVFNNRR